VQGLPRLSPILRHPREKHASRSAQRIDYSQPWRRVPRVHAGDTNVVGLSVNVKL
jgi:hypothetical protein